MFENELLEALKMQISLSTDDKNEQVLELAKKALSGNVEALISLIDIIHCDSYSKGYDACIFDAED